MNKPPPSDNAAAQLRAVLTSTDHLTVNPNGDLVIEGCVASDLLAQYGSPLYVISEATLRANYRRVCRAFGKVWPASVNVLYAIKANTTLAVRAILHQEGAGGDCFGEAEMHATFLAGADPAKVALNGSNKSYQDLRRAAELGVMVNVDAEDEIDMLAELAKQLGKELRVGLRLKSLTPEYSRQETDYFGLAPGALTEYVRRVKWGFTVDAAEPLVRRLKTLPGIDFRGYHFHIGRASRDPGFQQRWATALADAVLERHRRTVFVPAVLASGGGWLRQRDPESRSLALNSITVEEYATTACTVLLERLEEVGMTVPELWVEPGRYVVGNAVVLLGTVGASKRDLGLKWVNVDISTNNLPRIDTSGSAYHVLPASNMQRPCTETVTIVGPTCTDSIIGADRLMPALHRGEPVAVLDAGMYAESASTQFNSQPRPATVLVNGDDVEVVKERETVADVFAKHRIPERLRSIAVHASGVGAFPS